MGVHRERIEVLHNAVNPDWAARYRTPQERERLLQKLAISADRKIILIVGRLSREKDHQTLLRAIHELRKTSPHMVHLIIVGEGPERRPIEAMICQLALQNCVTLVGQVPSAEPYYGIADASVLSSLSEGSPNALLESMAARVPAVATSVGGIPEIATDRETALLVPTHDAQRMADAIALLLTDPGFAQRITQNAHELVRTRFTPEARYGRLMEIYRDVASPSSSRLL
jgi:glycosyltransferase involved in cell wall biosynthesis